MVVRATNQTRTDGGKKKGGRSQFAALYTSPLPSKVHASRLAIHHSDSSSGKHTNGTEGKANEPWIFSMVDPGSSARGPRLLFRAPLARGAEGAFLAAVAGGAAALGAGAAALGLGVGRTPAPSSSSTSFPPANEQDERTTRGGEGKSTLASALRWLAHIRNEGREERAKKGEGGHEFSLLD
jgi:hypothetical protein